MRRIQVSIPAFAPEAGAFLVGPEEAFPCVRVSAVFGVPHQQVDDPVHAPLVAGA